MDHDDSFSILALDGGGVRGIYGACLLSKIEEALGARIKDCFDLIAGTSTGSILAGAAATAIPMADIVELFERESPRIFRKRRFAPGVSMLWRSRYSRHELDDVLQRYVHGTTLGEVPTPFMITSADLAAGGVHVFKSGYLAALGGPYDRDGEVLLKDAILASCAAPDLLRSQGNRIPSPGRRRPLGEQPVHHRPHRSPVQVQQDHRRSQGAVHRDRPRPEYVSPPATLGTADRLG